MPSFGGNPGNRPAPRPAPPPAPAAPRQATHMQGFAPSPHMDAPAARNAYVPPVSGGSDAATSGPGYGSAEASAYKATPQYHQAVKDVFLAQPQERQGVILHNLLTTQKSLWTPELHAIADAWHSMPVDQVMGLQKYLPHTRWDGILHELAYAAANYGATTPGHGSVSSGASAPAPWDMTNYRTIAKNAGKDAVNLVPETISTLGTVGGDLLSAHPGKAASDVLGPILQTFEHPIHAALNHPLLTYLMFTGAGHGVSRAAAAPVRALVAPDSVVGRALSTQREGVQLTGNLTHERPPYSKSPTVKAQQVALEKLLYTRNPAGELVPRTDWLRNRQITQEVSQLVGVRERIRAVNRDAVRSQRARSVVPPRIIRAAKATKRTLAYGAHPSVIPGGDVLALIADRTIRRPDTVAADLQKHLDVVRANRANLTGDPQALKANAATIATLEKALKNKAFLRNPAPAFKAAAAYAKDYRPVEARAAALGHFGADMTQEALDRRALMHYASAHMGAAVHPDLGLVRRAVDSAELRAAIAPLRAAQRRAEAQLRQPATDVGGAQRIIAAERNAAAMRKQIKTMWNDRVVPLSTDEIRRHLNGPDGTGGAMPAYTSDVVRFDREKAARKAGFTSDARRPLPVTKKNTLYAHTHGLTSIGHDALAERHMLMQGIVDAHHAQNAYLDALVHVPPHGAWQSFEEARRAAPPGYSPINIAQPFHSADALDQAMSGVSPATMEEEATRRSLDLADRLKPTPNGRWGIIDDHALKVLNDHRNQISPNVGLRAFRALNNQFRTVALSTSFKHIPGVVQENLIRDIANGVGFRSWVTGHRMLREARSVDAQKAGELRTQLTGGQVAGMTEAAMKYHVSDHWKGTTVEPFLKSFEAAAKAPGPRQLMTAWKAWSHFAIHNTKRLLEEQHQIAGLGKHALREHGYVEAAKTAGMMGLIQRAFGLHGQMLQDATRGLFDERKARQARATIQQIYGKWNDLTPHAQTALMFSPFGLWWVNSAKFLMRSPIDRPVQTAALAGATEGTQKRRDAAGLNMLAPNALPLYEQGGIPLAGGKVLAQNYYSPFGIANDPIATGQSLIQPWLTGPMTAALGVNWLGHSLESPGDPHGRKSANMAQRAQAIIDSVLSSFLPLYTKAKQVAEGGASAYDVNGKGVLPWPPATKTPGRGPLAGLKKATQPFRTYSIPQPSGSSSSGSNGVPELGGGSSGVPELGGSGASIPQLGG